VPKALARPMMMMPFESSVGESSSDSAMHRELIAIAERIDRFRDATGGGIP